MKNTQTMAEQFFLEWYNDFLTVERFAEYHMINKDEAIRLIERGRLEHREKTGGVL